MFVRRLIAANALALIALLCVASAQIPEGRIYSLHSKSVGGCPSLDWHIVVGANGILEGMIAWDHMRVLAKAVGAVNQQSHTFTMTVKEVGGLARTARVDGHIKENGWIIANIKGPNVTCSAVVVPIYVPSPDAG